MNAALSITNRLFATSAVSATTIAPPILLCACGEITEPKDSVLYQNHYWNTTTRQWVRGDCSMDCCECGKKHRLPVYSPMLNYRRDFRRVVNEWGH